MKTLFLSNMSKSRRLNLNKFGLYEYAIEIFCLVTDFSCGHATLSEALSVGPSVHRVSPSVTLELTMQKTRIYDAAVGIARV